MVVENNTNRIININGVGDPLPAGGGYTQVDAIKTKWTFFGGYYKPAVGDILDHTRIEDLYDIKVSASGGIGANQKSRLKSVLNGWGNEQTRKIKTVKPPKRVNAKGIFVDNPYVRNGTRLFALFGMAGAAWTMIDLDGEQEQKLQAVIDKAVFIKNHKNPDPQLHAVDVMLWWNTEVREYLETIIPEDSVRNLSVATGTIFILYHQLGLDVN